MGFYSDAVEGAVLEEDGGVGVIGLDDGAQGR